MKHFSSVCSALALVSASLVLPGCLATESESGDVLQGPPPVAQGTLKVMVTGDAASYYVVLASGDYVPLNLDHIQPTAMPGSERPINWSTAGGSNVLVFGEKLDDGSIDVDQLKPATDGEGTISRALTGALGERKVLAI